MVKIKQVGAFTAYHIYLHTELREAVSAYQRAQAEVSKHPPITEENATGELVHLYHMLEQKRAGAILMAASCVEAVANLYLAMKTTPEQFAILDRVDFVGKWTVAPSFLVQNYTFPKGGQLYQDLNRLHQQRNRLAHLKEEVTVGKEVVHKGFHPINHGDDDAFLKRLRTLPVRLVTHLASFDKSDAVTRIAITLSFAWSEGKSDGAFRT